MADAALAWILISELLAESAACFAEDEACIAICMFTFAWETADDDELCKFTIEAWKRADSWLIDIALITDASL